MSKLSDIGKKYEELQTKSEAQAKVLKDINADWAACEAELLEALVDEGVNSIKLLGLGTISMKTRNFLSVNAGNKPMIFDYLRESGNEALLKLDVNPKTLTSFLSLHLAELVAAKVKEGADELDAQKECLEFLNKKGASYFTERGISFKRG